MEPIRIMLADDDRDDCLLFKEALDELSFSTQLNTVSDGDQLMELLLSGNPLPHILFLDINMPRKNGSECLLEMKLNERLKHIPVIIISTSADQSMINMLYKNGAQYYICKPTHFTVLKNAIEQVLTLATTNPVFQPTLENFVINGTLQSC